MSRETFNVPENNLDKKYQDLLKDILENGVKKGDRTGTGTISVFGREIRHNMSEGFPLLTTKKMAWKPMVIELLWFLRGDTNIKFLVENGCNIWVGDAYKNYVSHCKANDSKWNRWMRENEDGSLSMYTRSEFIEMIKLNVKFARKWGELGPIYGKQWRGNHFDLHLEILKRTKINLKFDFNKNDDQIKTLVETLRTNPDSRRLLVNAWNVKDLPKMVLPPCHYGFECWTRELTFEERLKIKENKYPVDTDDLDTEEKLDRYSISKRELSLKWIQRSVDTPLGLPFNIASYGLLLAMLSDEVNMIPGELIGSLGDTHIYLDQIDGVKEQISRIPFLELPTVKVRDGLYSTTINDITLEGYQSHGKIEFPLSN